MKFHLITNCKISGLKLVDKFETYLAQNILKLVKKTYHPFYFKLLLKTKTLTLLLSFVNLIKLDAPCPPLRFHRRMDIFILFIYSVSCFDAF